MAATLSRDSDERIKALNELHSQKVRSLMKSVHSLRAKVTELTKANKESNRSAHIQRLRTQIRELELVIDVLKVDLRDRELADVDNVTKAEQAAKMAEISKRIIEKTTGGPKRFRPKIREELEEELAMLQRKHNVLKQKHKNCGAASKKGSVPAASSRGNTPRRRASESKHGEPSRAPTPRTSVARQVMQRANEDSSKLADEVESLNEQLVAQRRANAELVAENEGLHSKLLELERTADNARRVSAKLAQVQAHVSELKEDNIQAAADREQAEEALRASQGECMFLREEADRLKFDVEAFQRDHEAKMQELQDKYLDVSNQLEASRSNQRERAGTAEVTRADRQQLADLKAQLDNKDAQIAKLRSQRQKLIEQAAEGKDGDQVAALQDELSKQTQRADDAEARVIEIQGAMQKAIDEATQSMEEGAAYADALKQENAKLTQQVEELGEAAGGADAEAVVKLQDQLDAVRAGAATTAAVLASTQAKLKSAAAETQHLRERAAKDEQELLQVCEMHEAHLTKSADGLTAAELAESLAAMQSVLRQYKATSEETAEIAGRQVQTSAAEAEEARAALTKLYAHASVLHNRLVSLRHTPPELPNLESLTHWGNNGHALVEGEVSHDAFVAGAGAGASASAGDDRVQAERSSKAGAPARKPKA